MIVGVGMFGVVAASAAAWFISADPKEQDKHRQADTITTLTAEITALRQTISELPARFPAQPQQPTRQMRNSPWDDTPDTVTDVPLGRQMLSGHTASPLR